MAGNPEATVYIGNLDERVDEKVVYEIMVQAGPLIYLYIPRDKESKKHKGYAFAEYPSHSDAQYAINLFSGFVCLYNRPLKFRISGQGVAVSQQSSGQITQKCTDQKTPNPGRATSSSPSASCGSDYLYGNGSPGGRRTESHMKVSNYRKSPLSQNPLVAEVLRYNTRMAAVCHRGVGSSVSPCAFT
ncbi:hypothetical protein SUGI_0990560 [Cryptomeria japonica]|uniref:uncharacterized protein LOC131033310 n=1 Tax=Cryptomeria japonica TaxID=3369 RepID=UPI002414C97B|nr:uncharacterized protein LOC131033310 [Cryptomeria japonica]GLJ46942.1 hypothetical protein SUGI_0990560 [Cryptomeria japonica]